MYLNLKKEKYEEIMKQIHVYKWTIPKIISNLEGEISELRRLEDLSLPKICTVLREELNLEVSSGNLSTILNRLKPVEENSEQKDIEVKNIHKQQSDKKAEIEQVEEKPKPAEENSFSEELNEKSQSYSISDFDRALRGLDPL